VVACAYPNVFPANQDRTRENVGKMVVGIILIIYVLLILEGTIRKWLFPQYAEFIFFIRVPVTLWLYVLVIKHGAWPRPSRYFFYGMVLAVIGLVLIPVQMWSGGYDSRYLLIAGYGWTNYFFYIPLAFIVADNLRSQDIYTIIKITLFLGVVAAPLVILQYVAPGDSSINKGFGVGELHQFVGLGFGAGQVRPMGLFSSSVGHQVFTASIVAFVMALVIAGKKDVNRMLVLAASIALVVMIGLSIQRGLILHSVLVVGSAVMGSVLTLRSRVLLRGALYPAMLCILGILIYLYFFPQAYETFAHRWTEAHQSESEAYGAGGILARVMYESTKFTMMMEDVPVFGYLLGFGGNAATQLSWLELPDTAYLWSGDSGWSEDGLSRNIIELGPLFGSLFIVFRFALFFWLVRKAIWAARISADPLPLILTGVLAPLMLFYQMTGHGTLIGYTWMFIGFCMATIKEAAAHREIIRPMGIPLTLRYMDLGRE